MFLNETKPPLDEALAHYGVKGMRWGVRKTSSRDDGLDDDFKQAFRKRDVAAAGLLAVGAVATVLVLKRYGLVPKNSITRSAAKAAAGSAAGAAKNAFANKAKAKVQEGASRIAEERLKNHGSNPRNWTPRDEYDFPSNRVRREEYTGPAAEAHIRRGAHVVHTLDDDVWNMPVDFIRDRY